MSLHDFRVMLESAVPLWVYGLLIVVSIAGYVYVWGRNVKK